MNKIPARLSDYVLHKSAPATTAAMRIALAEIYKMILVIDDDERLMGVISKANCANYYEHYKNTDTYASLTCADICTRNFCYLTTMQDKYLYGRNLFAEHNFNEIPILDHENVPQDIFGRFQAFFLDFFNRNLLPRMWYAICIVNAVIDAKKYGYDRISVIEFGVSSGNGLYCAELLCEACERQYGVEIDLYGFDSGEGLYLARKGGDDLPNIFGSGWYRDDMNDVRKRLRKAKLVVGDICDTTKNFLPSVAPIGAMFIDVDLYTPTVAILRMLEKEDTFYLPEVYLYFDDLTMHSGLKNTNKLGRFFENQGEWLAVREFNARNRDLKISPESIMIEPHYNHKTSKIKICQRFKHPKFGSVSRFTIKSLPLRN